MGGQNVCVCVRVLYFSFVKNKPAKHKLCWSLRVWMSHCLNECKNAKKTTKIWPKKQQKQACTFFWECFQLNCSDVHYCDVSPPFFPEMWLVYSRVSHCVMRIYGERCKAFDVIFFRGLVFVSCLDLQQADSSHSLPCGWRKWVIFLFFNVFNIFLPVHVGACVCTGACACAPCAPSPNKSLTLLITLMC